MNKIFREKKKNKKSSEGHSHGVIGFPRRSISGRRETKQCPSLSELCDLFSPDPMFLVGSLLRFGSVIFWIVHIIACMGGCLGIHCKYKLITSISEPLKRPKLQEQKASKLSISEDFWTTNTCEMDNSAVQSQGSISSISTSTLTVDPHGTSSRNTPSEFVNPGLLLWNQTRLQWIGNKKSENQAQQLREPKLSWNATYESLLGSNKPFRRPIPLPEMVDFLVDIWEQDGLYD